MHRINIDRLIKLAEFLEKLPVKKFNFDLVRNECGTVACAIGWTPEVFPEDVYYSGILRSHNDANMCGWVSVAKELFNMTYYEVMALFCPRSTESISPYGDYTDSGDYTESIPTSYGLKQLGPDAKPKEVAKNIRLFVSRCESGEIV